jgi:hypothetical protein
MKLYPNARIPPLIHHSGSWISSTTLLPRVSRTRQHLVLLLPILPGLYMSSESAMCRALTGSGHFCIRAIHHPFRLPVLLPGHGNWVRRIHLFKLNNRIDYHYSVWPALILSVYFVDFLGVDLGRGFLEMVHGTLTTSDVNKRYGGNRSSLSVLT